MTNFFKYDVILVKFPFASSLKYKARPAIATIEKDFILTKLGKLKENDIQRLDSILKSMC